MPSCIHLHKNKSNDEMGVYSVRSATHRTFKWLLDPSVLAASGRWCPLFQHVENGASKNVKASLITYFCLVNFQYPVNPVFSHPKWRCRLCHHLLPLFNTEAKVSQINLWHVCQVKQQSPDFSWKKNTLIFILIKTSWNDRYSLGKQIWDIVGRFKLTLRLCEKCENRWGVHVLS